MLDADAEALWLAFAELDADWLALMLALWLADTDADALWLADTDALVDWLADADTEAD